ncbi:PREDICTED: protein cutoff-like [Drosophila arizonae]|uniref:Decapping nuclease n=1 Tax=Drosophila arizonae TaxID=7263 RepID=A0ABM1PBU2_DROAR|nr:PREDICTED: protein cutoff-like [Drosophila arizonae]
MSSAPIIFKLNKYRKHTKNKRNQAKTNGFNLPPRVLGGFSVTSERIYKDDAHLMKFLLIPDADSFPLNLNNVNIAYNGRDQHAEYLDNMLHFIRDHRDAMVYGSAVRADIVTQENVLTTLLCTLYRKSNWRILGSRYRDTLYLCLARPQSNEASAEQLARERRNCMETKLKHLIYSDTPHLPPNARSPSGEFYGVFSRNIGELAVVYASSMGGHRVQPFDAPDSWPGTFVECKVIQPPRFKPRPVDALSWWFECYLKDVNDIYIARPKSSGLVHKLQKCTLATLMRDNIKNWSCEKCIDLMHFLLLQMRKVMELDNPSAVYQFDYIARSGVLTFSLIAERNEQTFISDWYRQMLEKPQGSISHNASA